MTDAASHIAAAHLFGVAHTPTPSEGVSGIGDLRLLGVFAQRDGEGFALFRSGSRGSMLVAAGHDVAPGVKLVGVHNDGVTLLDGALKRDILLRAQPGADKPRVVASATAASTTCASPAGFSGQVVRLNAELLDGMISAPDAWKGLLQVSSGILTVRDQSGFAGMLGLHRGDRIERANGIALAIPDDISNAVLRPLTRNQSVWVSGTRAGKSQQWLLLNAGACPG